MLEIGLAFWLMVLALFAPGAETPVSSTEATSTDFARDVRPILQKRCQPCHFPGGSMHGTLPFDQAATIDKLGTKLFTRIKKEDEQKIIRAFLSRGSAAAPRSSRNSG